MTVPRRPLASAQAQALRTPGASARAGQQGIPLAPPRLGPLALPALAGRGRLGCRFAFSTCRRWCGLLLRDKVSAMNAVRILKVVDDELIAALPGLRSLKGAGPGGGEAEVDVT